MKLKKLSVQVQETAPRHWEARVKGGVAISSDANADVAFHGSGPTAEVALERAFGSAKKRRAKKKTRRRSRRYVR